MAKFRRKRDPQPEASGESNPLDWLRQLSAKTPGWPKLWGDVRRLDADHRAGWGIAWLTLGPVRLVTEARRCGWSPGKLDALRLGALSVAQAADAAQIQRYREFRSKIATQSGKVPGWFADRHSAPNNSENREIEVDDAPPFD